MFIQKLKGLTIVHDLTPKNIELWSFFWKNRFL